MPPGPVSDSYDPEFGTGENAHEVREAIKEGLAKISETLPCGLKEIVSVATGPQGKTVSIKLTERQRRALRFAINRALETV